MNSFWKGKRVFITGASGLLGSWLTKKLIDCGADVIILMRDFNPQRELLKSSDYKKTYVVNGQLEDIETLKRAISSYKVEYIFHLGAQAIVDTALENPLETFESNIRGSYNLLEAARLHGKSIKGIVVASSDKAYGHSKSLPYLEEHPLSGKYPYEVSKSCADMIAMSYYHTYKLPIAISRCGNIYGGADTNWNRIVPGTVLSFYKNESPIIRSSGDFLRDYLYVEDVVDAYLLLAQNLQRKEIQGEAFNLAPGKPYAVFEIVSLISRAMNKAHLKPTVLSRAEKEIKDQFLNCSKAEKLLNWKPKHSLEEGLKKTIKWYEKYFTV